MVFQIILVAFATFAIVRTWQQHRARRVSKHWFQVISLFWTVVAIIAITPATTDVVAKYLGVGRGADLLVYIGVVALFYAVHRLMAKQQRLSDDLTALVRQLAIEAADKPKTP